MRAIRYRYFMWRASRTDDFTLQYYYERKASKALGEDWV